MKMFVVLEISEGEERSPQAVSNNEKGDIFRGKDLKKANAFSKARPYRHTIRDIQMSHF